MSKVIQLILFCQFVFVQGTPSVDDSLLDSNLPVHDEYLVQQAESSSRPLDSLKLGIMRDSNSILRVNLKQTTRVLANGNLPVWTLEEKGSITFTVDEKYRRLKRNYEVMKQLGEFTAYQELETSSAAIYFHKRREFDGMIDNELLIQKLSVDNIHPTKETLVKLGTPGVYDRPNLMGEDHDDGDYKIDDPGAGVNDQKQIKTYKGHLYEGYPEVLVIISWDLANEWTRDVEKVDFYTTIVSQVLTIFNGVDMLFSKLKKTKIQINIAGIVIASGEKSLSFLDRCHPHDRSKKELDRNWIDANCVNLVLHYILRNDMQEIPPDSYDLAIFLTSANLSKSMKVGDRDESKEHLKGYATGRDNIYEIRKSGSAVTLVASVTSREYLENYPVIAHEMAHLLTLRHDPLISSMQEGQCCKHLMKIGGRYCNTCLSWSETSEETFYSFFSSPNCCEFINKPRSLNPPGPQLMLTADEQCKCYGYQSAKKYHKVLCSFCQSPIQCKTVDNDFDRTVIPMDGTSCGKQKVCWQRRCEKIGTATSFSLLV